MIYVDTGTFTYDIEAETSADVRSGLRMQYDEVMDFAEQQLSSTTDARRKLELEKHIDGSWDTVSAIAEAIASLEDGEKAVVFLLFQQVIGEAASIFGNRKEEPKTRSSNGGVRPDADFAIDQALNTEIARSPLEGPVNLGNVADALQAIGINRQWRSLARRLHLKGVVLPTTFKSDCRPLGDNKRRVTTR